MKQTMYRTEAFIIPTGNEYPDFVPTNLYVKTTLNEVGSTTVNIEKNKSNCLYNDKNNSFFMENENIQNLKNCITFQKIEMNFIKTNKVNKDNSINFYSSLDIPRTRYEILYDTNNACFSLSESNKVLKLSTINEKNEVSKVREPCYHGCKNGCSATVSIPQKVTEVFKNDWLQKLEDIKQREAALKSKEINLQNHKRALFKKEKEIKLLECLLKDKLKQIDLYFKENKHVQELLRLHNLQKYTSESLTSFDSKGILKESCINNNSTEKLANLDTNKLNLCIQNIQIQDMFHTQTEQVDKHTKNVGTIYKDLQQEKISISSFCSSGNSVPTEKRSTRQTNFKNSMFPNTSKSSYHNSSKAKKPYKIYYEDLDTTLSADIGDSSFVQTSQKFRPELYKKPYACTRSGSERHGKFVDDRSDINLEVQNLSNPKDEIQTPVRIEQNKVLKRVTQNISASQDKSTKFQNYGLIDYNIDINKVYRIENEERYSYLNLEMNDRLCPCPKLIKSSKDRPISWNQETNEWLQKKRKAYNMSMRRVTLKDEIKENFKYGIKTNKSEKVITKKDIKNKILTMFH